MGQNTKAMYRVDLHERFVEILKERFSKRSELVDYVSDILRIEREPASRRISGRVHFSVTEMGILAGKLGISLDSLLYQTDSRHIIPFQLEYPKTMPSFSIIFELLEKNIIQHKRILEEPADIGMIMDSLPIEFFAHYPELCKFLYFTWGHFFVGNSEFKRYDDWSIPPRLDRLNKEILKIYGQYRSAVYIWNNPIIWNLANDIKYLLDIGALRREDAGKIKADLHKMMDDLEDVAGRNIYNGIALENSEFYVSSVNIGMTLSCIMGDNRSMCFFKTYFIHSYTSEDSTFCTQARSWINSLKRVSTLISGSGEKERTLFFKEQHRIIDTV